MVKFRLSLILLFVSVIATQSLSAKTNRFEQLLNETIDPEGPGSAAIVTQGDKTLFLGARGMANIELGTKLEPNHVFRLGSITKQFTGAAIMMLHEQEKLSVTDNIKKYVPDFPTEGHDITIAQLLTHTSGLANYTDSGETMTTRIQEQISLDDLVAHFYDEKMHFAPGDAMRYSNTGYVLLGKIIEVASGLSYAEYIDQNIFQKLGMKNSYYGGRQIIKNRALGYTQGPSGIENAAFIDMSWPHAAGSLLGNVEDLNTWFRSLKDGRVITLDGYQKMISPYVLNDGNESSYGYGLNVYKVNKYDAIGHSGGIPGFGTNAFYIPEKDLFVAVFNNTDRGNPGLLALKLTAIALEIDIPEFKTVELDAKTLKSMAGVYTLATGSTRTLSYEDGALFSQRDEGRKFKVTPMSENSFYFENSVTYFELVENNEGKLVMNFYANLATEPELAVRN